MAVKQTQADGWGYDDAVTPPAVGPMVGWPFKFHGQTGNTVATNTANQPIGTVAVPALVAGAKGQVTITNSMITATSIVLATIRRGTTTPAAGVLATIGVAAITPTAGSIVFDVWNGGSSTTLSTDYQLWFLVMN